MPSYVEGDKQEPEEKVNQVLSSFDFLIHFCLYVAPRNTS